VKSDRSGHDKLPSARDRIRQEMRPSAPARLLGGDAMRIRHSVSSEDKVKTKNSMASGPVSRILQALFETNKLFEMNGEPSSMV
jgi:hypothetical protein